MAVAKVRWMSTPSNFELSGNDVQVWSVNLDQSPASVELLAQTLSREELARSERFRFEQHRARFVICRGVLRAILGRYLGVKPSQLQFVYGNLGKPYLAERHGGGDLCFNVTHSGRLALYAFALQREVGIDLEHINGETECRQIAARFFSPREYAVLGSLPASVKQKAFFACWTRKEAFIKAKGDGVAFPLNRFSVSLTPGEPAKLLAVDGDPLEASRWSMWDLSPAPDYAAALVAAGQGLQVSCWEWQGLAKTEQQEGRIS